MKPTKTPPSKSGYYWGHYKETKNWDNSVNPAAWGLLEVNLEYGDMLLFGEETSVTLDFSKFDMWSKQITEPK